MTIVITTNTGYVKLRKISSQVVSYVITRKLEVIIYLGKLTSQCNLKLQLDSKLNKIFMIEAGILAKFCLYFRDEAE